RAEAEATLQKWADAARDHVAAETVDPLVEVALRDDLNTSGAIARMHALFAAGDIPHLLSALDLVGLDISALPRKADVDLSGYALALADLRSEAMQSKNFEAVDRMKTALMNAGIEVRMSKDGVDLVPGPGFDAKKLESIA
ncbi:MAG: cysteine--tRNA ligase, partial [Pseudomonadota bacterium]